MTCELDLTMDSPLCFHQLSKSSKVLFSQPSSKVCEGAACDYAAVRVRRAPLERKH